MNLVYLSPVPWSSFAQRPHKFVSWFHASTGGSVLWVDPYPTRFPCLSDFRRLGASPDRENDTNPNWLSVINPSALPIEPLPGSGLVNAIMWRSLLRDIDNFVRRKNYLLVIGKPSVLALTVLKRLKGCMSLYDAMDDFPAFYTGISRVAMRWREAKLVSHVDGIWASSSVIKHRWSRIGANVQLVQNGLDAATIPMFTGRHEPTSKKILGYVGSVATWFDWDWVIALAKVRSDDVVRLIGPVSCLIPTGLPNNIEMLPACSHQMAIEAMQKFDVGLIPFKNNILTASVDPIKYYEYRTIGLPIISTCFGEMAFRFDEAGTFISQGLQDIAGLVEKALQYSATNDSIQKFRDVNTWDYRFDNANII